MQMLLGLFVAFAVAAGGVAAGEVVAPTGEFGWPLQPQPQVVHPFQAPLTRYGPGHRGADLAGAAGQPVLAAGDGTVTHSGVIAGRGTVSVTHANGWRTTYEPLEDRIAVGSTVHRGDYVGTLAAGGHCGDQPCLHWGLVVAPDTYRDPLTLLRAPDIVLLPP